MPFTSAAVLESLFGVGAVPGSRARTSDARRLYLPELTGLRGVAIIIVVCGHLLERVQRFYSDEGSLTHLEKELFEIFATPFSGCCIFFCISGYSLMTYLHFKVRTLDRYAVTNYIERRLLRLYPPYFVVLAVTFSFLAATRYAPVGTNQFFVRPQSLTVSLFASLALVHDLAFGTFPRLFPPGWFIETQFQFYLVGPALWILYLKVQAGRLRFAVGIAALIVSSFVSLLIVRYGRMEYSIVAFMPYFWTGALLADLRLSSKHDLTAVAPRRFWRVGWIGLAALIFLGMPLASVSLQLVLRLACLAVVFCAFSIEDSGFQRALLNPWLTRIGVACYSIYLVHLQILQVVTPKIVDLSGHASALPVVAACAVVGLMLVAAASAVFYWLIERPCVAASQLIFPSTKAPRGARTARERAEFGPVPSDRMADAELEASGKRSEGRDVA
jgi:peptidoglycan/LPS O-acetylase OafA/YrhL